MYAQCLHKITLAPTCRIDLPIRLYLCVFFSFLFSWKVKKGADS
jgi:hypothetical protein